MRQRAVVMQRWDVSCGAAALATLLTHDLGDPVTERAVAEGMLRRTDPLKVRVQGGFSLLDLQEFAEARGYEADGYGRVSLDDLVALAPAIVPVRFHGYDHFVVFRGVRGKRVVLADPAFGRRTASVSEFERAWKLRVAFVVAPRPAAAAEASEPEAPEPTGAAPVRPPIEAPPAGEGKEDRDETARALERALVRQGALVLRPGAIELEPGLDYLYRESAAVRRDTVTGAVAARIGLPLGAQAEARVPYVLVDDSPGTGGRSGFGDASLGLTKQLLVGSPGASLPDLLVAARWKTTTGRSGGDLAQGTGAHALDALLTAVRRDDPLVLVGTAYYVWNFRSSGGVDRGDAVGAVLSTLLAATPYTSFLVGFDVATVFATRVSGASVPGTDRLTGVLNVGLYTIVTRDVFLNVTGAFGVTPAAPDFELTIALPFRL
jgi:predicted double-glycine peptidase